MNDENISKDQMESDNSSSNQPSAPPLELVDNVGSITNRGSSMASLWFKWTSDWQENAIFLVSNVTLEPAMFLISFTNAMGLAAQNQILNYKSCINDFHQDPATCNNLTAPENALLKDKVTDEVAQFNVYLSLVTNVIPALMQFYVGAWADIFGRKRLMFSVLGASILGGVIGLCSQIYVSARKEWILLNYIPLSLVGGFPVWILCLFAFIADISEPKERAFRMMMITLAGNWGSPAAPIVGAKIFNFGNSLYENGGYALIGVVWVALYCVATVILYLCVRRYNWNPESKQRQNVQKRTLISIAHVKDSLSTFFKPRNGMNRKLLWMLVFMFILQVTPLFAEVTIAYLYTFFRYDWQVDQYSNYQSITSLARVVSMTVFVPIIKATNANEIYIVLGTNLTFIARCFIKGIALDGWIYYLGAFVDVLGGYGDPCVRAMIAICVPMEELGKVYSLIAMCESLIPMFVPQIYSSLFQATKNTVPGSVFFLSMALLSAAYGILLWIAVTLRGKRLSDVVSPHELPLAKGPMLQLYAANLKKEHL